MKAYRFLLASVIFSLVTPTYAATIGNYKEVDCALPVFSSNGCAPSANVQCFEGGTVVAGQKLTGLSDSFTNKTKAEQVLIKEELEYPSLVNLGGAGTSWLSNPKEETDFWKVGGDVVFTPSKTTGSGAKTNEFAMKPGQTYKVLEVSLGANYQLEKTDKKNGDYVGLVKFPVNFHNVDDVTGQLSATVKHLECVAYALSAPVAQAAEIKPVAKTPPTTPPQATNVKTGAADTFLFFGLAMLLALAFMFARKRKSI
jgi:LPXTG-motif cell wall-anchored protein